MYTLQILWLTMVVVTGFNIVGWLLAKILIELRKK